MSTALSLSLASSACGTPREWGHSLPSTACPTPRERSQPLPSACPRETYWSSAPTTAASLADDARLVLDCGHKIPEVAEESEDDADADTCVVCLAQPMCMAIVPCGHLSMCQACCGCVEACPVCRGSVDKALRILAD